MTYVYRAQAELPVSAEQAWRVLVDFPSYGAWNPFTPVVRVEGGLGAPVRMAVRMDFWRVTLAQTEALCAWQPPHLLAWELDIGLPWLLRARREQRLLPTAQGCRYVTEDTIGGLLAPLVHALFGGSVQRGFEGVARALAARCAAGPAPERSASGPSAPAP